MTKKSIPPSKTPRKAKTGPNPANGKKEPEGSTKGLTVRTALRPEMEGDEQEDLDPYEIEFLPQFRRNRGPRSVFVNRHGVIVGDHDYESEQSPLENWTNETDPAVMAGDEWVHPYKDVGFHTAENKDYFEKGIPPQSGVFMHPDKDVAYKAYWGRAGDDNGDSSTGDS